MAFNNGSYRGNGQRPTSWQEMPNCSFVNPYTFVPLPKTAPVRQNPAHEQGTLSGVIDCTLTVKTPLAIPDASAVYTVPKAAALQKLTGAVFDREPGKLTEHKIYPFMRVRDGRQELLTIPGSSLRGMLRSLYETASGSCLSVAKNRYFGTRQRGFNSKAGVLQRGEDGRWQLFEAIRYRLDTDDLGNRHRPLSGVTPKRFPRDGGVLRGLGLTTGDSVTATVQECELGRGMTAGYVTELHADAQGKGVLLVVPNKGLSFANGHYSSVFVPNGGAQPFSAETLDSALERLISTLEDYAANAADKWKEKEAFAQMLAVYKNGKATRLPVWYRQAGGVLYFSISQQGRISLQNDLWTLLGGVEGFVPCRDPACLCPACRLFGMVGKAGALCGKLRVGDALCTEQSPQTVYRTLEPLGAPKPSATEFYFTLPDTEPGTVPAHLPAGTKSWTADDFTPKQGRIVGLRGRKFYWHHEPQPGNAEPTNLNSTMELAQPGTSFRFRISFDGLTQAELDGLLWCLTLGDNTPESPLQQKLGHGKPLGYGSVKIRVQSRTIRSVGLRDGKAYYAVQQMPLVQPQPWPFAQDCCGELCAVLNTGSVQNKRVCYPLGDDGGNSKNSKASHQWFAGNRDADVPNSNAVHYILPPATAENQQLPGYRKK